MTEPPDIVVRAARGDDAEPIARLSATLGYPVATADSAGRLERLSARHGDDIALLAERRAAVVGWIHGAAQHVYRKHLEPRR